MSNIDRLFKQNRIWMESQKARQPDFFSRTSKTQQPEYLWIGCCDSRVPAELITGLQPGEVLVHRNIANQFHSSDTNGYSILQFALTALNIRKVIVAGHTNCGGVCAAMTNSATGEMATWLTPLKKLYQNNQATIDQQETEENRINMLCRLNIKEQVKNLAHSKIAKQIWMQKEPLTVDGVIYDISTGELKNMDCRIDSMP